MRGCWATGRMFHQFDTTTHRCKCGRWQAGFAPKKETKSAKAECQVCELSQCLTKDGVLVHHGYERPGDGWIHGDCFGVAHKPFPAYDALVLWHDAIEGELERSLQRAEDLLVAVDLPYQYTEYLGGGRKRQAVRTLRVGDKADYTPNFSHPSFEDHRAYLIRLNDRHIEQVQEERVRVAKRIVAALGAA